jgi:hypothetical protein
MFRTILAVLTFSVVASASTATFATTTGAMAAGQPVSATVTIGTADGGIVTVTLTDNAAVTTDAGQLLSDLFFTLGTTPTSLGSSTIPTVAPLIDIAGNGTVTTDGSAIASWGLSNSGATIHLDSLTGGATQTIIGPGPYAGNGSINGNPGHNPFINQTASFSFTVGGVDHTTTITAASFSFGTTAGLNVSGCIPGGPSCTSVTTPEPISSALVGSGLIGLFFLGRRRMTRKA